MSQTVIGLFKNESDAQRAVQSLEQMGLGRDMVDISRGSGSTGTTGSGSFNDSSSGNVSDSREGENGVSRFFKSLFGDSDDADRYSRMGNSGYSVVTVHAQNSSDAERAADILDEYGAVDVDENSSGYSGMQATGNDRTDLTSDRQNINAYRDSDLDRQNITTNRDSDITTNRDSDNDATVSRVQEELHVGKREVEKGGVRVRSRIVEKPVEESVRLREEHVRVDRQQVNRPLTDADRSAFQDQDIELTERTEVPVVNKESRVVEEIRISKDVEERTETIRDTVRNTEVDIDQIGDQNNSNLNNSNLNNSNLNNSDLNTNNLNRNQDDRTRY
jgi:stress response protein YsnF